MAVSENDLVVGPIVLASGVSVISLDFYFELEEWLDVYKSGSEEPLLIDVDYTVSGEGTSSGSVTLNTAANGVDSYSIYLTVPLQRSSDMQLRGEFKSGPFNVELDRIWQAIQGKSTLLARALKVGRTSQTVPEIVIGVDDDTDNRTLIFNDDSTQLNVGPSADEIANAQGYAEDASADRIQTALDVLATAENLSQAQDEKAAATLAKDDAEDAQAAAEAAAVATPRPELLRATWAELLTQMGSAAWEGSEVLAADTGTHNNATATGYDGDVVDNAGTYIWRADWSRWEWVGPERFSELAEQQIQIAGKVGKEIIDTSGVGIKAFNEAGKLVAILGGETGSATVTYVDDDRFIEFSVEEGVGLSVYGWTVNAQNIDYATVMRIDADGFITQEVDLNGLSVTYDGAAGSDGSATGPIYTATRSYVEVGGDACTDLVFVWHGIDAAPSFVQYRVKGSGAWMSAGATKRDIPFSTEKVFSARVQNLSPFTVYEWQTGGADADDIKLTRTAPDDAIRPARVSVISDAQSPYGQYIDPTSVFNQLNDLIADDDTDVIVLNGDYVNDNGNQTENLTGYFLDLIDAIASRFIRSDGTFIPIVVTTGNHEVDSAEWYVGTGDRGYVDIFFNCLYREQWDTTGGGGYGYFTIGKEALVVCLDTNHGSTLAEQALWLSSDIVPMAGDYRHVLVVGHFGPFASQAVYWDTPANERSIVHQELRRDILPLLQDLPNFRVYVYGHEHHIVATTLMKTSATETGANHDFTQDVDGWRAVGAGGWIANASTFSTSTRVSDADASSWVDMALAGDTAPVEINVTPISPITSEKLDPALKHFWRVTMGDTSITTECINLNGASYATYTDSIA